MTLEASHEDSLREKALKALMLTSGATNTSLIESEPLSFLHGARETDAVDFGASSGSVVFIVGIDSFDKIDLANWGRYLWHRNSLLNAILSFPHCWTISPSVPFQTTIAISRSAFEDISVNISDAAEGISWSSAAIQEGEFESAPRRGTLYLAHHEGLLFSKTMELRTADLPRWKPHVVIDRRRFGVDE